MIFISGIILRRMDLGLHQCNANVIFCLQIVSMNSQFTGYNLHITQFNIRKCATCPPSFIRVSFMCDHLVFPYICTNQSTNVNIQLQLGSLRTKTTQLFK